MLLNVFVFQSVGLHPDRHLHPGVDVSLLAALHLPVPRATQHLGASDQGGGWVMVMLHQVMCCTDIQYQG